VSVMLERKSTHRVPGGRAIMWTQECDKFTLPCGQRSGEAAKPNRKRKERKDVKARKIQPFDYTRFLVAATTSAGFTQTRVGSARVELLFASLRPFAFYAFSVRCWFSASTAEVHMKIGIAGTGRMGSAIAQRLIECGHAVTVWNRTAGRAVH
jgi:hypothetical protein